MSSKEAREKSQQAGLDVLRRYLALGSKFENPPSVSGELITESFPGRDPVNVLDIAATTARQCYYGDVAPMKSRPQHHFIAHDTLDSGHDTTRLHHQVTFKLNGVSRETIHAILHGNPFYNSDQQSQRYAEAKMGFYLIPAGLTGEQRSIFLEAADYTNQQYQVLMETLRSEINRRVRETYPKAGWKVEETRLRLEEKIKKAGQELARYVLPIAQQSVLDHTLSELQLLRLFRASQMPNFSDESRYVIGRMVETVAQADPKFLDELRQPITSFPAIETEPFPQEYILQQKQEFDDRLNGFSSAMVDKDGNPRSTLANAVRNVLGRPSKVLSDEEALDMLFNPAKNPLLADTMEAGILDPLTACLRQVQFTFETRLSHTADSQRQRHRRTPGATPSLEAVYDGSPDYITPMVVSESPELKERYDAVMEKVFHNVSRAIDAGIPLEHALTLLPNAVTLRVTESGDLFDWIHRWKQRLCANAQEEIYFDSLDQVEQVLAVLPEAAPALVAPCKIREVAGIKPRCPESKRWCGLPVFRLELSQYRHNRLI